MTTTPQARAAKDCPSFGISTSGLARGGPTCFAPQEAHSEELISRFSPQQGQIIESRRDFLFIVGVYGIQGSGRPHISYAISHISHAISRISYGITLNGVMAQAQVFRLLFFLRFILLSFDPGEISGGFHLADC